MRLYLCVRKRYRYVLPDRAEKKVRLFQAHTRIRKQEKRFGAENAALTRLEQKRLRQSHTSAEFLVLCVLLRGRFPPAAISIAYVSGIFCTLRATLRQMPNGYVNRIRQRIFGTLRATSRQMPCGYVNRIRQRNIIIFLGTLHATSRQMPILTRAISRQVPVEPVSTN